MHGLPEGEGAFFTQNFVDSATDLRNTVHWHTFQYWRNGLSGRRKLKTFPGETMKQTPLNKKKNRSRKTAFLLCVCLGSNVGCYFLPLTKTLTNRQMLYSHKFCVSASLSHRYANTKKCLTPVQAKIVNSFFLVEHQQLHSTYKRTLWSLFCEIEVFYFGVKLSHRECDLFPLYFSHTPYRCFT